MDRRGWRRRGARKVEGGEAAGPVVPVEQPAGQPESHTQLEPLDLPPGPLNREQLEALDTAEAAAPTDPGRWDLPPADERLTPYFWRDPEPNFQGMLSADRIRAYHYAVGRMIRPFQEEHLKPAAYELTLGPRWVIEGETRYLTDEQPVLTIPPNSIVFASMREMLLLPHWLVARFDLSIQFIYDGLLLGTGPQVDPGFKGVLSCPLHNISSQPITLEYKKPFAKMDFVKTSFSLVSVSNIESQEELYARAASGELRGFQNETPKLWKREKTYRRPIFFAGTADKVKSSVRELEARVDVFETDVGATVDKFGTRVSDAERSLRRSQIGAVFAALALVVGLLAAAYGLGGIVTNYVDGRVSDVRSDTELRRLRTQIDTLSNDLATAQREQRKLADELKARQRQAGQTP